MFGFIKGKKKNESIPASPVSMCSHAEYSTTGPEGQPGAVISLCRSCADQLKSPAILRAHDLSSFAPSSTHSRKSSSRKSSRIHPIDLDIRSDHPISIQSRSSAGKLVDPHKFQSSERYDQEYQYDRESEGEADHSDHDQDEVRDEGDERNEVEKDERDEVKDERDEEKDQETERGETEMGQGEMDNLRESIGQLASSLKDVRSSMTDGPESAVSVGQQYMNKKIREKFTRPDGSIDIKGLEKYLAKLRAAVISAEQLNSSQSTRN